MNKFYGIRVGMSLTLFALLSMHLVEAGTSTIKNSTKQTITNLEVWNARDQRAHSFFIREIKPGHLVKFNENDLRGAEFGGASYLYNGNSFITTAQQIKCGPPGYHRWNYEITERGFDTASDWEKRACEIQERYE